MADIKYFFLEQGGTPDVFSYGGKCWKKLTRTRQSGELVSNPSGIYNNIDECRCDSGNNDPTPVEPECSKVDLNIQSSQDRIHDYSYNQRGMCI